MCGILASFNSIQYHINTLPLLFYRGADSFGFGQFDINPNIFKKIGHVINKDEVECLDWNDKNPIISHCRWSSTGKVALENTHPFISQYENILTVHNGTITNYKELLDIINDAYSYQPVGDTDTEIVGEYISYMMDEDYNASLSYIQQDLEGTWAIVFVHQNYFDKLFFLRYTNPLYYYNGQLSSDAELFDECMEIPDNSYGYIRRYQDKFELYINGKLHEPNYNLKHISKIDVPQIAETPMLSEIKEQATLDYNCEQIGSMFFNYWNAKTDKIFHYHAIKLYGEGSSYYAALLGRKYFQDVKITCNVEFAAEYNFTGNESYDRDFRLAITQSGETLDVLDVMQKLYPSPNFLLTNKKLSSCSKYATQVFPLNVGTERAIAATKTFTASALSLYTMSLYAACDKNGFFHIINDIATFKQQIQEILSETTLIQYLATTISSYKHMLILGGGYYFPIACEFALKLKEVARIHAEAQVIHQVKHGPIALIDKDVLSIAIMGDRSNSKYDIMLGNLEQIKSRGGKIIGIGVIKEKVFDEFIHVPMKHKQLHSLACNVVGQLLAYYIAIHKKYDTTYIPHLSKAVTVL